MKAKKYCILVIVSLGFFASLSGNVWETAKARQPTKDKKTYQRPITLDEHWASIKPSKSFKWCENQRDTLSGLGAMAVEVNILPLSKLEEYGLSEQQLRVDVELRLRQNDIKILPRTKLPWLSEQTLLISITSVIHENVGVAGYNLSVELYEKAVVLRDLKTVCYAVTWKDHLIAVGSLKSINTNIRESLRDMVDRFINDYLAANPKEPVKKKAPTLDELLENAKLKGEQKQ